MEIELAKRIGSRIAVRTLILVLIVLEFLWMWNETRGDFANGILFYIERHNIYILILYVLFFSMMYYCGRCAGKEVLVDNKRFLWTGIKYALYTLGIILMYAIITISLRGGRFTPILRMIYVLIVPLNIIWIWSTWKMTLKKCSANENT